MNENNQITEAEPPAVWPPVVSGVNAQETPFARQIFVSRFLTAAAAFLAIATALRERTDEPLIWGLLLGCVLLWPPLAFLVARKSRTRSSAEGRSLYGDALLGGAWMPLIGFSLLPALTLFLITAMHSLACGGGRLVSRTLPLQLAAAIGVTFLLMYLDLFQPQPRSGPGVILATLPLLLVYPLRVSAGAWRLGRQLDQRTRALEHLTLTDPLSGLANRRYWEQALVLEFERSQRRNQPCTLVLMDIDQLQRFNECYGDSVGDEVIVATADAISATLRAYDTAARYGGDEFGILLPDTDSDQARIVLSRVRTSLRESRAVKDLPEPCTLSIGIRTLQPDAPDLPETPALWLSQADLALSEAVRQARRNGQNLPDQAPAS